MADIRSQFEISNDQGNPIPSEITDGTNIAEITPEGLVKIQNRVSPVGTAAFEGTLFSSFASNLIDDIEVPFALMRNPTNGTKTATIYYIITASITKGRTADFMFYASPTVTDVGTQLATVNRKRVGTPPTSEMLLYEMPTTSDNGNHFSSISVGVNSNSIIHNLNGSLIIGPDHDVLLTAVSSGSKTELDVSVIWAERPLS